MPWIARGCSPYTKLRVVASKGRYAGRVPGAAAASKCTIWSSAWVREPEGWIVPTVGAAVLSRTSTAEPTGDVEPVLGMGAGATFFERSMPSAMGTMSVMCVSGP
jgi:hypothetical protein